MTTQPSTRTQCDGLRFGLEPVPVVPARGRKIAELDCLKTTLLQRELQKDRQIPLTGFLSQVADEAAALAWLTSCPILVLPVLMEEKFRNAREYSAKRERLLNRTSPGSVAENAFSA